MYQLLHDLDIQLFQTINHLPHNVISDGIATLLWQQLTLILALISLSLWYFLDKKNKYIPILAFFIFLIVAFTNQFLFKSLFQRFRPYQKIPQTITVYSQLDDYSFPSGHAASVMAYALPYLIYLKNKTIKWSLIGLVFLIGIDRIYMGHHYPADVMAGYLVGVVFSLIGVTFYQKYQRKKCGKRLYGV